MEKHIISRFKKSNLCKVSLKMSTQVASLYAFYCAFPDSAVGQPRLRDFDLNDACNDAEEAEDGAQTMVTVACNGNGSPNYPVWMTRDPQQQSPQQTSGNSDSLSTQSLSSSNGDAQVYVFTSRIFSLMHQLTRPRSTGMVKYNALSLQITTIMPC